MPLQSTAHIELSEPGFAQRRFPPENAASPRARAGHGLRSGHFALRSEHFALRVQRTGQTRQESAPYAHALAPTQPRIPAERRELSPLRIADMPDTAQDEVNAANNLP